MHFYVAFFSSKNALSVARLFSELSQTKTEQQYCFHLNFCDVNILEKSIKLVSEILDSSTAVIQKEMLKGRVKISNSKPTEIE